MKSNMNKNRCLKSCNLIATFGSSPKKNLDLTSPPFFVKTQMIIKNYIYIYIYRLLKKSIKTSTRSKFKIIEKRKSNWRINLHILTRLMW